MVVSSADLFQRAVPSRTVDANRPDRNPVGSGIGDDLRWRIEPHRLRIDKGRTEHIRMVAFDIGRGVGDESKGRGMALGKAIGAKTLEGGVADPVPPLAFIGYPHELGKFFPIANRLFVEWAMTAVLKKR